MKPRIRLSAMLVAIPLLAVGGYFSLTVWGQPAATPAPVPATAPRVQTTVTISLVGTSPTRSETIGVNVSVTPPGTLGQLTVNVNSVPETQPRNLVSPITISLPSEGENTISVSFQPADPTRLPSQSNSVTVELDRTGPMLQHAEVVDVPATGTTLIVTFADDDLPLALTSDQFQVVRQDNDGNFTSSGRVLPQGVPEAVRRTVRLRFATLPAGLYRLIVKGTTGADGSNASAASNSALTDVLGNPAGNSRDQTWEFSVLAERKFGAHVEFPPFTPPKQQAIPPEGFNPGDFVETRVARLYYYRDAHRVAQILNRNIRSYNQAAVTQAERRAEAARDDFEDKVDARRENEREAVLAAQAARNAEAKLADARTVQGIAQQVDAQLKALETRKNEINGELTEVNRLEEIARTDQANADNKAQQADGARQQALTAQQSADQAATNLSLATQRLDEARAQMPPDPVAIAAREQERNDATRAASVAQANATNLATNAANLAREAQDLRQKADQSRAAAIARAAAVQSDKLRSELQQIDTETSRLREQQSKIGDPSALAQSTLAMEQSIANLRQTEIVKQESSHVAQAAEDRAASKKFRAEVTAAETDPDTYVAGDFNSVDPVTQVSISVIGEGLIQLRGPIKGINKIRTMINQIDSPVGQIKIGIFSVQVNGEKGDKMEKVIGDAESNIDLSRFLVNHSLELLRRSIQSEAASIAAQCEGEGHYQVDRDRRYLYAFFGRDFIDELYEMDSEFLKTENKLLSLHAMDTVSLNRALFILALAKNDVRERIVAQFLESTQTELADAEYDFRRSSELQPHRTQKLFPPWDLTHLPYRNNYKLEEKMYEAVHRNAMQRYHFRNLSGFFDTGFVNPDTMNPMQREFIRLAQIFKARLVAEMEWKQRVLERGLIEDRSNDEDDIFKVLDGVRKKAYGQLGVAYDGVLDAVANLVRATTVLDQIESELAKLPEYVSLHAHGLALTNIQNELAAKLEEANRKATQANQPELTRAEFLRGFYQNDLSIKNFQSVFAGLVNAKWLTRAEREKVVDSLDKLESRRAAGDPPPFTDLGSVYTLVAERVQVWKSVPIKFQSFRNAILSKDSDLRQLDSSYAELKELLKNQQDTEFGAKIGELCAQLYVDKQKFLTASATVDFVKGFLNDTRAPLDHRKLLNHMIDEQEEKFIELVEGTRAHIAVMDQYLKRLSIALEDDFKVQYYDPMFVRVRDAARSHEVNLGQVERTTILTNNRAFAKVDPQATMEFDLPKRQIAIKEAFDAAKALVEDTGALVNDPTFLAAFQMMGGSQQPATVKNLVPGQTTSTDQQNMGLVPQQQQGGAPGSALQSLVPEPAIYKLETGTGFQIRPVMQPDGDSVVYDFDYMYTTNIREPVRADEKHVGRIKRHFVHTAVQTGNYELREISRYQVALKVSRTSQGVPLLQDIPIVGAAFRPAPSAESSIQQNIILGQTNVYPTLFDLMGLRWAQQVVDLDHTSLLETEHVVRGRQKSMRDYVFKVASERVDEFLDIGAKAPDSYRPDFYHSQTLASPHHPGGYDYPYGVKDPTGNGYEQIDRRPQDMQEPPYDRYRHQPVSPERIGPQAVPERIPLNRSQLDQEHIEFRGPRPISIESSSRRDPRLSPQFNESTYRDSGRGRDSAVVPARFEEPEQPRRDVQMRRLPPVR
jgi:hypothetical protein